MNLHEYQGKRILAQYGVTVQKGRVVSTIEQINEATESLQQETGTQFFVIKAQIHAGGRGKGTVIETGSRGVVLAKNKSEVQGKVAGILGGHLITAQTSEQGKRVNQVFIAEDVYYPGEDSPKEYYVSILLDRKSGKDVIVYSTEGGMDIEQVAHQTPELIHREFIDAALGIQIFQARKIATNLGLVKGTAHKAMVQFIQNLYAAYAGSDASLFEINPVLKTSDNKILAVDAKVSLDDNALYRHADLAQMHDPLEEDPMDLEAKMAGLNYVKLDGNVGCMVNGAGLAMATMDIIKLSGGSPANFLDVGGTANAERVEKAFHLILKDPNVKAILVNIFGGIVRCDRVAQGIIDA